MRFLSFYRQCEAVLLVFVLGAVAAFALDYFYLSSLPGVAEVGFGDLEITFVIIDNEMGQPVKDAVIEVPESQSSFCSECDEPFRLTTDKNGRAARLCKQCMWYGMSGGARLFGKRKSTFNTHMPHWLFHISANGYETSDKIFLPDQDRHTLERGEIAATMEVSIKLRRLPVEK